MVDKQYIMRYLLDRIEHKDGTVTYEMPKEGTKAYNDNLIISTHLAVLESEHSIRLLFTPGNFEEPKRLGYTISYIQSKINEGKLLDIDYNLNELWQEASKLSNSQLKKKTKKSTNLIYNNTQVQFHKQNMIAGKLIGIFAQANVSHAFLSIENDAYLNFGKDINFIFDNMTVAGEYPIDRIYSNDGITYISSYLASLLAASVDAVKDPILNLANINTDTVNIIVSMIRLGFSIEQAVLLVNQPVIINMVKELGVLNASSDYHKGLNVLVDDYIQRTEGKYNLSEIKLDTDSLIDNLDGHNELTEYMTVQTVHQLLTIADTFRDITHMTRYNSITSAVGPSATDTMLMKLKDIQAYKNELFTDSVRKACGMDKFLNPNSILYSFRDAAYLIERGILGNNIIQASENYFKAIVRLNDILGYLSPETARKFSDFYMSFYVNAGNKSIFDLENIERRRMMIQDFPLYFQNIKSKYSDNAFINSIILKNLKTEQYPSLQLKTRGLSDEDLEDLKLSWASLYNQGGEARDLAMQLAEYCFFRGGFGFNPKTFMKLIPNIIKVNLGDYVNVLNKKNSKIDISLDIDEKDLIRNRLILLFLLHNPDIIRDKYWKTGAYNPLPQKDGTLLVNVHPDESKLSKKPKRPLRVIGKDTPMGWTVASPIIVFGGKPYYVKGSNITRTSEGLAIKLQPVSYLGGNGQGFEIDVNNSFPESIYSYDDTKTKYSKSELTGNSTSYNYRLISTLLASLFRKEELELMLIEDRKNETFTNEGLVNTINDRLKDNNIKLKKTDKPFKIYYSGNSKNGNETAIRSILRQVKDIESIDKFLEKTSKDLEKLGLCN